MLSINNSQSALLAANNLKRAALDEKTALARLSTGRASSSPGDRVTEESMATGLKVQHSLMRVASDTTSQAKEVVNIAYEATSEMLDMLIRSLSIANQCRSDNVTDRERNINNQEFKSLAKNYDLTAERATYNGVTLLSGLYSGDTSVQTQNPSGSKIYDITSFDQYTSYGVVGSNPLLEKNSSVSVTTKIGEKKATGTIRFSENLKAGDRVVINGREFTAVDTTTIIGTLAANQFELGQDLENTLANLVRQLNASTFTEVTPSSYSYNMVQIVPSGSSSTPTNPIEGVLYVHHNVSGSVGNDFKIGVSMASPIDKDIPGSVHAHGSIEFMGGVNLCEGYQIKVNGVTFKAMNSPSAVSDTEFPIEPTLAETLANLASVLNASSNPAVSGATYTVNQNKTGIDITYKSGGAEGNKFKVGLDNSALVGAKYFSIDDALQANPTMFDVVTIHDAAATAGVTYAGVTITLARNADKVTFSSVADAAHVVQDTDFEKGANPNTFWANFASAFNKYVNADANKGKWGGLSADITTASATATDIVIRDQSGKDFGTGYIQVKGLSTYTPATTGATPTPAVPAATGSTINGLNVLEDSAYSATLGITPTSAGAVGLATHAVGVVSYTAASTENFVAGDVIQLTFNDGTGSATPPTTDYTFSATPDPLSSAIAIGATIDKSMQNLADAINIAPENGVYATVDATGHKLILTARKAGVDGGKGIKFAFTPKTGTGASTAKLTVTATAAAASAAIAATELKDFTSTGSSAGKDGIEQEIVNAATANGISMTNTAEVIGFGGASEMSGQKATMVIRVLDDGKKIAAAEKLTVGGVDYAMPASLTLANNILKSHDISDTRRSFFELAKVVKDAANANINLYVGSSKVDSKGQKYFDVYIEAKPDAAHTATGTENSANNAKTVTLNAANVSVKLVNGLQAATEYDKSVTVMANIKFEDNAKKADVLSGSVLGVDKQVILNTNVVRINSAGAAVPANGKLEGTLMGGRDRTSGTQASVRVKFSDSVTAGKNFKELDTVVVNGTTFTFSTAQLLASAQGVVSIGQTLDETLSNLAYAVNNNLGGDASKALLQYDRGLHTMIITYHTAGTEGNNYSFNLGGTDVLYDIGDGAETTNKVVKLGDIAKRQISGAVLGAASAQPAFSQRLQGDLSGFQGLFKAGSVNPDINDNRFVSNSVQFRVQLNGVQYESEYISLSGGNVVSGLGMGKGYGGLGNHIAGGTEIVFYKVGGLANEVGIKLKISDAGFTLNRSSIADIQDELNLLSGVVNNAIRVGDLKIGITAPEKFIPTYGLRSIEQFESNGISAYGAHLLGKVEVLNSTGLNAAQGVIEFDANKFQNGDYLMINGTKVIFHQDVKVGLSLINTMKSLATFLNSSQDENIAQATYSLDQSGRLIISYKNPGIDGNEFKLQANFAAVQNGAKARINGNPKFSSVTEEVALGEVDIGVSDIFVIKGTNRVFSDDTLPVDLIGGFSAFQADFIEGSVITDATNNNAFVPNKVAFTAIINGAVYSGNISLSGGSRLDGAVTGTSYNGLGGLIAGGSKIVLNSADKKSSIVLTVDRSGIDITGADKNEVTRKLDVALAEMMSGISQIQIGQRRIVSGLNIESLQESLLRGLRSENVSFLSSEFDKNGEGGRVSKFKFDKEKSTLSVKIGNDTYSQTLSIPVSQGGIGDKFDSVNQIISGGVYTTLTLKRENGFGSLQINLSGVSDIDLSSDTAIKHFESSLNNLFNASESSGLTFQVGTRSEDLVVLNFPDLRTKSLFRDDQGNYRDLDVSTKEGANTTSQILEKAVLKVRQAKATMGSSYSQFDVVLNVLRASMRATESAISVLWDADMPAATMDHTLSLIRSNSAASGLVHTLSSLRDIMNRLLQV